MRHGPPSDSDTVYVSDAQSNPSVFHTTTRCNYLPAAYTARPRREATAAGLRECDHCLTTRYDVLEL